jgi:hypothetical protein
VNIFSFGRLNEVSLIIISLSNVIPIVVFKAMTLTI